MKKLLFVLLLPCLLFAAGGDTLEYDTGVQEVENNNATDSDVNVFYHPMKDSIQSIINGRLGNVNIASDAQIKPSKLDTADTLIMQRIRTDTIKATISLLDTVLSDSARITFLKSQRTYLDSILNCDTIFTRTLKTENLDIDTISSDTIFSSKIETDSLGFGVSSKIGYFNDTTFVCTLTISAGTLSGDSIGVYRIITIDDITTMTVSGIDATASGAIATATIKNNSDEYENYLGSFIGNGNQYAPATIHNLGSGDLSTGVLQLNCCATKNLQITHDAATTVQVIYGSVVWIE
jgi:hypothetical protein